MLLVMWSILAIGGGGCLKINAWKNALYRTEYSMGRSHWCNSIHISDTDFHHVRTWNSILLFPFNSHQGKQIKDLFSCGT